MSPCPKRSNRRHYITTDERLGKVAPLHLQINQIGPRTINMTTKFVYVRNNGVTRGVSHDKLRNEWGGQRKARQACLSKFGCSHRMLNDFQVIGSINLASSQGTIRPTHTDLVNESAKREDT